MIKYKVVSGDTLSKIALHYYGDSKLYKLLASANGIKNPDLIKIGDTISILDHLYEKDKTSKDGGAALLLLNLFQCLIQEPRCSVALNKNEFLFCGTGKDETIQATGDPIGGLYSWEISDTTIASLSENGDSVVITPLKVGKTDVVVTYKLGNVSNTHKAEIKVCTCTPGRKYANAMTEKAGVVGIKAKIKTRHGKIAGEEMKCKKVAAYYVTYANISGNLNNKLVWAQSGFGRERQAGSAVIKAYRYAEMMGKSYKVKYDNANAPGDNSDHIYECVLDGKKGQWTYYQDGKKWQVFADAGWKNLTGESAQWTGEIYNAEDDMSGTSSAKCEISECQIKLQGKEYESPKLTADEVNSGDAAEWGAERISEDALNIWDANPLW
jgi:hypothetical protein